MPEPADLLDGNENKLGENEREFDEDEDNIEFGEQDANMIEAMKHLKAALSSLDTPAQMPFWVMRSDIGRSIAALLVKGKDEHYDNVIKLVIAMKAADRLEDFVEKTIKFSEIAVRASFFASEE